MQFFDNTTFWGRVKERLWANGMTVRTLADRLGESYKSMTNRISNDRIPKKKGSDAFTDPFDDHFPAAE